MFRSIEAILERWRAGDRREPLVVEGVHGCGKTHTLERFAERFFPDHVRLDLRENAAEQAVSVGQPVRIVSEIGRLTGTEVTERTLIVLDNLERSPAVMDNVRRLAASGLCAGVACACARVGTVPGSVPMHPMSFDEFLVACGEESLAESLSDPFSETVASSHGRLLSLMREYWAVGGLPGAVSAWLSTGDSRMVDQEISRVLDSIREDAMLSVPGIAGTLWSVMTSVPEQLSGRNRKFMFSRAVPGARSKTLFESIRWLESCGAVHRLRIAEDVDPADDGDSIPPSFKLYAFDTGALRVLAGIPLEMLLSEQRAAAVPADGLAEDFALIEMVRSGMRGMYCWRSGNRAEVAFVIDSGEHRVPMQLNIGRMAFTRSIAEFRRRHPSEKGVYLSPLAPDRETDPVRIPIYAAGHLRDILPEASTASSMGQQD